MEMSPRKARDGDVQHGNKYTRIHMAFFDIIGKHIRGINDQGWEIWRCLG